MTYYSVAEKHYIQLRSFVGEAGTKTTKATALGRGVGKSRAFVRYHATKYMYRHTHDQQWGGRRWGLFTAVGEQYAQLALWCEIRENAQQTQQQLVDAVRTKYNTPITLNWLRRVFKEWRMSCKAVTYRVIRKYSRENILYYW